MASEVDEFEHNESLCISFNEEVNGEKYNSVLNIQDEKQVLSKELHPIVDRSTTRTWVDVVKLDIVKKHVKAKVMEDKLDISIIPLHESVASSDGVEKASEPSTKAPASLITIPTVSRFIERRIHEHAVDEVTSPQNLVELTQKTPNESVTSNSKSIKKVKSQKVVKEAARNVHANAFDALTSDEVHEEPIKSREEVESMRREKAEGKLKSRKKGQAEKLQLLKTHKEAEEREKEREKRLRKKERKKAEKSIPPPNKLTKSITTFIIILLVFCLCLRIILS